VQYALSFSPVIVFFAYNNYLYGTVMAFLMLYFIINHLELEQNSKNGKLYKKIIAGILFSTLPVMAKLATMVTHPKESNDAIMIAIVSGVVIAFVAASISLAAGMKRIKGDKNIHE
jgi:hypothetical protein